MTQGLGAFAGGLVGSVLAQAATAGLQSVKPVFVESTEGLLWWGGVVFAQVALAITGMAVGMSVSRNRVFQRPIWRFREIGRAVVAGLGGGLVAGVIAVAIAAVARPVSMTGGSVASWSFGLGLFLVASTAMGAAGWFSTRVVPNVSRPGLVIVALVAGGIWAMLLRLIVRAGVPWEWVSLIAATAIGSGVWGAALGIAEALSSGPFLDLVRMGGRRTRLNLGQTPVSLGSDAGRCDVLTSGPLPITLRYWIDSGQICVFDHATGQPARIPIGDKRSVGGVIVTIESSQARLSAGPSPTSGSRPSWMTSGGSRAAVGSRAPPSGSRPPVAPSAGSRGGIGPPPPPPPPPSPPPVRP